MVAAPELMSASMVAAPELLSASALPQRRCVATLLIDNYDSYTYNIYQMLAQVNGVAPIVVRNDDFGGDWAAAWRAFEHQARQQYAVSKRANSSSCSSSFSVSADAASSTDSSSDSANEEEDDDASTLDDATECTDSNDYDGLVLNVVISPGPGHPGIAADFGMCADAIRFARVPLLGVCLGHQGLAHVYGGRVLSAPEVMHGRTSRVFLSDTERKTPTLFACIPDGLEVVRYHSLVVDDASLPSTLHVTARTADGVVMALQHAHKPQFGVQFHPEAVCSSFGYQLFQNFRDLTLAQRATPCRLQHSSAQPHALERAVVAGVPRSLAPPASISASAPAYTVHVRVAARGVASPAFADSVFTALYADARRSFWLDSSNFDAVAGTGTGSNADTQSAAARSTSRFSLMGDGAGPLSYAVESCILENVLRVYECDSTRVWHERGSDILSHLRAKMAELHAHTVEFGGDSSHDDCASLPFAFRGGFVGYFGYEVLGSGVDAADNSDCDNSSSGAIRQSMAKQLAARDYVPDASFLFADRTLVFDHVAQQVYAVSVSRADPIGGCLDTATAQWHNDVASRLAALQHTFTTTPPAVLLPVPASSARSTDDSVVFYPSRSKAQYARDIAEVQRLIRAGETYEVCLTNQLEAAYSVADPVAFYRLLRTRNPAPYAALYVVNPLGAFASSHGPPVATTSDSTPVDASTLSTGLAPSYAVCCSSPERFLRVDADGWMESKPIKGTRRRGVTPSEDAAIARELALCVKDRAENMMIADLVRNDFGVVAEVGSVHVPTLMGVETYATVHQLVTTVRAQRRDDADTVDVLHATFPGGSMTGAPKRRTMTVIRDLEQAPRGVYSGALGYLALDGSCDFNIVIRTAVVTPTRVTLGSGGAVIALSDTDDEYDEMLLKTRALVHAIGAFATGRDDGARVDAGN